MKSVQQTVERWKASAGAAQQRYSDGIQNTSVDVVGRAIANAGAAVRGYTDSITSGRWAAALNASGGTANWKSQSQKKASNYGTGIAAGEDKFNRSMQKLLPALEAIVSGLPARQPGDVMGNVQRRVGGIAQALHQAKGQFKG